MRGFNTLRFETTVDNAGVPGGGLTPGGLQEGVSAPEPEPAAPAWEGVSEQDWQQAQEMLQQQSQMLEQLAPVAEYLQAAPQPQIDGQTYLQPPDPMISENWQQDMEQYLEARDAQRLAPYEEVFHERRMEELEGRARDMIHDVQSRNGEILAPQYEEGQDGLKPDDLILEIAKSYSPAMVSQYGEGVRADEAAIEAAYQDVKLLYDGWSAAREAQQANQITALTQAPREPGSSGIAAQTVVTTQPGGWDAFKNRHGLS